ncbi:MAG: sigma-70 family RNA polymerase sigma factor [Patescibacteria group bacterium]
MKKQPLENTTEEILTKAFEDYRGPLLGYAFQKVNNYATSADLVQDTFLKAWGYILKGEKIYSMKSFLYRVLNNLIVDHYRKHKTISLEALIEEGHEPSEGGLNVTLNAIEAKAIFPLIELLPSKYQKVMRMWYFDDMSIKEMSMRTKESKNNISVQVHRGLEKLRHLYNHEALAR